jgi:hypothetical protein
MLHLLLPRPILALLRLHLLPLVCRPNAKVAVLPKDPVYHAFDVMEVNSSSFDVIKVSS